MNDATKQAVQKLGTKFQWQESMAPVIHTIGMLKVFVFFNLHGFFVGMSLSHAVPVC